MEPLLGSAKVQMTIVIGVGIESMTAGLGLGGLGNVELIPTCSGFYPTET